MVDICCVPDTDGLESESFGFRGMIDGLVFGLPNDLGRVLVFALVSYFESNLFRQTIRLGSFC